MDDYNKKAEAFLEATGTAMFIEFVGKKKHFADDKESRDVYRVTFTRAHKGFSVDFGQSIDATEKCIKPTAYDVLACLQKSDVGSFEDFCADFGYSDDSIKATKIYEAVCKEYADVCSLWTEAEIEKLAEVQ